jgi:hypothetical protein
VASASTVEEGFAGRMGTVGVAAAGSVRRATEVSMAPPVWVASTDAISCVAAACRQTSRAERGWRRRECGAEGWRRSTDATSLVDAAAAARLLVVHVAAAQVRG